MYEKDHVFSKLYEELEDKKFYQKSDKLPLVTPFVDKKTDIDRSTLYSISKPFEKIHADIVDLRFLEKSATDPKYCLLIVNLFTSKIYVYTMKKDTYLQKNQTYFIMILKTKELGKCYYKQT